MKNLEVKKLKQIKQKKGKSILKNKVILLSAIAILLFAAACSAAPTAAPENTAESSTAISESTQPAAGTEPEGCLGSAETALVDLKCREVTIAVENAYLPFNYIEISTGKPGGWDYEAWTEVCTRLHCIPVFKETAWDGLIQSVADGQSDVGANGITITDKRLEIVDFSVGYISLQQRLLVRRGETRFTSITDFQTNQTLTIGAQSGTTNYETAAKYVPEGRIKAYEQMPFAVQALMASEIDAVLIDNVAGLGFQGENADKLELIGESLSSDELGFFFPKGSELVAPVNQAVEAMKADGVMDKINLKYFGPDFKITIEDIKS